MKIPTMETRINLRENRLSQKGWHRWFAWYLVEIDGYVYWLRFVERKYEQSEYADTPPLVKYREAKK